jgi:hypothetical protein
MRTFRQSPRGPVEPEIRSLLSMKASLPTSALILLDDTVASESTSRLGEFLSLPIIRNNQSLA